MDGLSDTEIAYRVNAFANSVLTRYFGLLGFTIMVWDHIITFEDEYEYIWKGKKTLFVYLFLLNRYIIPLSFVVNIFAYFSHVWDNDTSVLTFEYGGAVTDLLSRCQRFVVYEGAMTMIGITNSSLMMFLRIRALYRERKAVQGFVFAILVGFVAVNSWLLTRAQPVFIRSPHIISCTMVFDRTLGPIAASSAWLPLLYDTVVVILTIIRTVPSVWNRTAGTIVSVLLREGIVYYSVIFAVTLTLTAMIAAANTGVKNLCAQLELCLTVAMVSRITLDLKRVAKSGSLGNLPVKVPHTNVAADAWNSVTRPSRMHIVSRGRVHHIERRPSGVEEETFFTTATQGSIPSYLQVRVDMTASTCSGEDIEMDMWEGMQSPEKKV
ncbi:hypothetical protein OF83DRAFT_1171288 [Amylostereum chailletii]|nr:hypothetical protein OF83DRAFT_1171288 [Amylostereum chailletii]